MLAPKARREFLGHCESTGLAYAQILYELDRSLTHVYFPTRGFISRISVLDKAHPLDLGLIGTEGMLGAIVALDARRKPLRAIVRGAGSALRMSTPAFRRALREVPGLLRIVQRYLYVMLVDLGRSSGCTRFHSMEQRLARWLLMLHDRANSDHFYVTQRALGEMIGVRRAGVTAAAGMLKRGGLIRYRRGHMDILDRGGLEKRACSCYAALVRDYAAMIAATN